MSDDVVKVSYIEDQPIVFPAVPAADQPPVGPFHKVVFQRGRDVVDFELNESQDILRVNSYRGMFQGSQEIVASGAPPVPPTPFGVSLNPGSNDEGFLVVGTGANNAVNIMAGFLFCDGVPYPLPVPGTSPPVYSSSTPAIAGFTGESPNNFATRGSAGTDVLYMGLTMVDVPDPASVPQLGNTTNRWQFQAQLLVSSTGPSTGPGTGGVPANESGNIWDAPGIVHYFVLANITRRAGDPVIRAADVTDARFPLLPTLYKNISSNLAALNAMSASNWPQPAIQWTFSLQAVYTAGPYCVVWNDSPPTPATYGPSAQNWLVAAWLAGAPPPGEVGVFYFTSDFSLGEATPMTQVGGVLNTTPAGLPTSMCVDTAGTIWVSIIPSNTVITVNPCTANSTFAAGTTHTLTVSGVVTDLKIAAIGTVVVVAAGNSSGGDAFLGLLASPGSISIEVVGLSVQEWVLKSNGSYALAINLGTSPAVVYKTSNGTTWTNVTITGLDASDLHWNAQLGLWIMVGGPITGDVFPFYTSPDGVTWTLRSSPSFKGLLGSATSIEGVFSVSSLGSVWVALVVDSSSVYHVVYSFDAISWYATPVQLTPGGGYGPALRASPTQVMACALANGSQVHGLLRPSLSVGLPDQPLT